MSIQDYFKIEELVDKATVNKYGQVRCWSFFDPRLLENLYWVRKAINSPITANNWLFGGSFTQRGLRTNLSSIVKNKTLNGRLYLSAHVRGAAVDFDVKGMEAEEVRNWLVANQANLPHPIRLEHKKNGTPISWVHMDVDHIEENPKVYLFDV